MARSSLAGAHYPRSLGEFQAWFRTDADCLDYLEWLRWPEGFVCPECGHPRAWELADGRYECRRRVPRADLAYGRDDLRQDAHAADGLVHRLLAVLKPEGRDPGAGAEALA